MKDQSEMSIYLEDDSNLEMKVTKRG
jgi:hypothetical protein